jgi:hypothetical protein
MSNYVQSTNFATKDALSSGDPLKIVKGTEINTEFNNIATAVATKADLVSPTFTGTPALPTGTTAVTQSAGNNSTALATTAFVQAADSAAITAERTATATLTNKTITGATITSASISGGTITGITDLAIADGGTGASTAANAFAALKQSATTSVTGVVQLATDVEAAAGTDALKSLTPSSLRGGLNATGSAPIFAARAWVNFQGTGTVTIRTSGNVSSVADNGTGDYTVNFATAMSDTDFAVVGTPSSGDSASVPAALVQAVGIGGADFTRTTTSVQFKNARTSTGADADAGSVNIAIFR